MKDNNIFIVDLIGIGGISTNVLVLSHYLKNSSISVVRSSIKNDVNHNIHFLSRPFQTIKSLSKCGQNLNFFINSARGLLFFYFLSLVFYFNWKQVTVKAIFVTYHPSEFSGLDLFSKFYRFIIHQLTTKNIWFMNSSCFLSHYIYSQSKISPIFLNLVVDNLILDNLIDSNDFNKKNILTVGRLVDFKIGYILQLINYANTNSDVNLVIVGGGPLQSKISEKIKLNKFSNIKWIDSVENKELRKFYEDCSIYVGMGTTLLEAAALKKPAIVSITGEFENLCYGWFSDQSDFNVGECQANSSVFCLSDMLDSYFKSPDSEKMHILQRQLIHSEKFSIGQTIKRLQSNLQKSNKFKLSFFSRLSFFIFLLTICIFEYIRFKLQNSTRYDKFN